MTPTIVVLRIDGHGAEHLSLHAKRQQAQRRLVEVADAAFLDRFGYHLCDAATTPEYASDRLVAEGWRVRLTEEPVEL